MLDSGWLYSDANNQAGTPIHYTHTLILKPIRSGLPFCSYLQPPANVFHSPWLLMTP